jgi:hypothetical protein
MKIKVDERERDTILAALRFWQWCCEGRGRAKLLDTARGQAIMEIAENERKGDDAALLVREIDALCERINCGG